MCAVVVGLARLPRTSGLGVASVTANGHHGWRIDSGQTIELDAGVPRRTLHRTLPHGAEVISTCEVLVRRTALWTFHGKLAFEGNDAIVTGDMRNAGPACTVAARTPLGWSGP